MNLWKSALENGIFWCQGLFFVNFGFKNEYENDFVDNNEKWAVDQEIGFPAKSSSKPLGLTSSFRQRGR